MRVLIVEDEAVIARRLERLVRELLGDQLGRLDVCADIDGAADLLAGAAVELVFLDLDLQGDDGFDLLRRAVAGAFHTIVVSAHTDRAIEAFALGVIDFVPKPFARDRLRQAVDRARGLVAGAQALRYLAIRATDGIELIAIDRVHHIAAADDYAELHLDDGTTRLHDKSLATLEALLPAQFLRIHRSHVVDLRRASHLRAEAGSRYALVLADGTELPVGRTRVAALRARLI